VMKDPKFEVIRIREELITRGLLQRSIKADAVEEFFNEEFMHSTSKGKDASDSTEVFCDLKRGEAFKLEYQWPVIV